MAYPPFYSSFTPPFYSFHHQPGVINFTHLCSPSPNLHYQDLNPIPAHSHHLSHLAAENFPTRNPQISFHQHPPMYNPQPTTTRSFIQQPPISNPTYLGHHGYYHEPIHHPEFLPLTNDSVSLLSPPTLMVEEDTVKSHECYVDPVFALVAEQKVAITKVKGEAEEVNSQEIITKNNFATIANEENLTIGERSQELIVTAEKDPPSFTQLIPQSILPSGDADPIASLSTISVCESDLGFTGSKPCFDLVFLASNPIRSSCSELETVAWTTTVPSPVKTKGNTISATLPEHSILVFDPSGSNVLNAKKQLECAVTNFVFETEKMAVNPISAPPPQCFIFVFDPGGYRHRFGLLVPLLNCVTVRRTHLQKLLSAALSLAKKNRVSQQAEHHAASAQFTLISILYGPSPYSVMEMQTFWPKPFFFSSLFIFTHCVATFLFGFGLPHCWASFSLLVYILGCLIVFWVFEIQYILRTKCFYKTNGM